MRLTADGKRNVEKAIAFLKKRIEVLKAEEKKRLVDESPLELMKKAHSEPKLIKL